MKPLRPHNWYKGTTCPGRVTGQVPTIRGLISKEDDDMKLLRGTPSGRVYSHGEGGKRHISPNEMKALVAAGYTSVGVPDAQLNSIPNVEVKSLEYPLRAIKRASHGAVYATDGTYKWGITSSALWAEMIKKGLMESGQLAVVSDNLWNRISNRPRALTTAEIEKAVHNVMLGPNYSKWRVHFNNIGGKIRQWCREGCAPGQDEIEQLIKEIPTASAEADVSAIAKAVADLIYARMKE